MEIYLFISKSLAAQIYSRSCNLQQENGDAPSSPRNGLNITSVLSHFQALLGFFWLKTYVHLPYITAMNFYCYKRFFLKFLVD